MKPTEASECGKNGQIFTRQSTCLSDSQKCCKFDFYIGLGGWGGRKWMGTGKKWVFSILIKWHSLRIICRAHNTNITYVCTYDISTRFFHLLQAMQQNSKALPFPAKDQISASWDQKPLKCVTTIGRPSEALFHWHSLGWALNASLQMHPCRGTLIIYFSRHKSSTVSVSVQTGGIAAPNIIHTFLTFQINGTTTQPERFHWWTLTVDLPQKDCDSVDSPSACEFYVGRADPRQR